MTRWLKASALKKYIIKVQLANGHYVRPKIHPIEADNEQEAKSIFCYRFPNTDINTIIAEEVK